MQTLDKTVEADARRMLCGILYFFDTSGEWPVGGQVNQMSGYKSAMDKAAVVAFMVENGWIRIESLSGEGHRVKRIYEGTDVGRAAVCQPDALPRIIPDRPMPLPDDEVEFRIYAYHLNFFKRYARWPNGLERARAFGGDKVKQISSDRRQKAYEALVNDGTLVRIHLWNQIGQQDCYVIPTESPEYADQHGTLYYAPSFQI